MRIGGQALGRVMANPALRAVATAFVGFAVAEYGVWVTVLVHAYAHGGTSVAAAIAVAQLLPGAVVAPLAARLIDARGAARMLTASYRLQAAALLLTGAAFASGAASIIGYAGAAVAAATVTLTRPAQSALLPRIVRTPSELTAANAAASVIDGVGMLAGPALAAVLITLGGTALSAPVFAAVLVAAAACVRRLPERHGEAVPGSLDAGVTDDRSPVTVAGLLGRTPRVAGPLAVMFGQYLVVGALDVLAVVLASRRFALGAGGAGYLQAMFGVGSVAGGLGAVALVGRRRLTGPVVAAAAAWSAALVVLGAGHDAAVACVLLALAGASRTVIDTAGRTSLHRAVPSALHGRMFGLLEGLSMVALAAGSLSVPWLVGAGGPSVALVGVAGALFATVLLASFALRRLDGEAAPPVAGVALSRA